MRDADETVREAATQRALLQGLSHELRAPLQSLLGHVDLLRNGTFGELSDEQAAALETVAGNAERILAVTRDVLQVARIGSGHEKVIVGEVDLAVLIRREIESIGPLAAAASLTLETECGDRLILVSDGEKIARILTNLVNNAVKYTREGGIVVRAAATEKGARVEVIDTGIGIAADDLDRVFDEYVRVDPGSEGTGLGLPIARQLAALLGGSLTLASAPGSGTTATLDLPDRG